MIQMGQKDLNALRLRPRKTDSLAHHRQYKRGAPRCVISEARFEREEGIGPRRCYCCDWISLHLSVEVTAVVLPAVKTARV